MGAQSYIKYYILNKEADYHRGYMEGMHCEGAYLWTDEQTHIRGVFFSRLYDSGEVGTVWHRLKLQKKGDHSASLHLFFFASDSPYIVENGQAVLLEDMIHRPAQQMSIEQKRQCFSSYLQLEAIDPEYMLLHQVKGRYLWFMAEVYCLEGAPVGIGNIQLYFPKQTWLKYLPEVYDRSAQGDTFLERYLSIFQTLYDDLAEKIEMIPLRLDAQATDERTLQWLAQWLGIRNIQLWNAEQLRYLVCHSAEFSRQRGTREGIRNLVYLYTGEFPFLVEQYEIERYAYHPWLYPLLQKLYGSDPYAFTVLVQAWCLTSQQNIANLQQIIEEAKPAWMSFRMITLRPYILLDRYSYLGINSVLGQYQSAELDEISMLSFSTIGEDTHKKMP